MANPEQRGHPSNDLCVSVTKKKVTLVRHAKASPITGGIRDFDRPLTDKGVRQAQQCGRLLTKRHFSYDRVLCSSSRRTLQTYEEIRSFFSQLPAQLPDCDTIDTLYHAPVEKLDQLLAQRNDEESHVMIIGHNPGLEDYLLDRCDGPEDYHLWLDQGFKTAGIATLELQSDRWAEIYGCRLHVLDYFRGKG